MSLFRNPFKKKESQATPRVKRPPVDPDTIAGCFVSHFTVIAGLLSNSQFSKRPVMTELFVSMLSTLEFVSFYYDIDIDNDRNKILTWYLSPFLELPRNELNQLTHKIDERLDFYRSRATVGNIRGDFFLDNISEAKRKWPPYRYSIIFCDCIYNQECLNDYDGAPIQVNGIIDSVNQIPLFTTIIREFEYYTEELKKYDND